MVQNFIERYDQQVIENQQEHINEKKCIDIWVIQGFLLD
jgi:hypothetical protein